MKKRALAILLTLALCAGLVSFTALAADLTFTDIEESEWYYSDVKTAVELGLLNGRSETTFAPGDNLTYSEVVKLAACIHQRYTTGSVTLTNGTVWYQPYVDYCKANGILNQDHDWSAAVTRAGYMEIFAKALPDEALTAVNTVADGAIPDVPVTHASAAAIYKLYRAGIVQGTDVDGSCAPDSTITRAEVAAILTRMMDSTQRKSFTLAVHIQHADWDSFVRKAVNDMLDTYGITSDQYDSTSYVVFDFDNTCSIFDVEEQLAVYQLQTMSFAFTPEQLPDILRTELGDNDALRGTDYCTVDSSYNSWIADITAAYTHLYTAYGPFTAAGLDADGQATVQADPQWSEFATKMRAMYDLVYDSESASVAYPWVLYWFTGMTEQEVYDLAYASHSYYKTVESEYVTWTSPESIPSKIGVATYEWTSGIQVSENIRELWATLQANGIDVWVCSASATDPIRAAVDAFGLHDYCTGILAMTNKVVDGKYINEYDYTTGCGWIANADGTWIRDTTPTQAQAQGVGKVTAVTNVLGARYGHGPMAGFMDSTGDYNFCTEFKTLKLVINFNRASRKVTDGGGVIAELAVYQRDTLGYDFAAADAKGDTLYVLQGRDENGLRSLRPSDRTLRLGKDSELLFRDENNAAQLQYMIDHQMTTEEIINTFAMKTAADAPGNELGFKYGFLTKYAGYHSHP